MNFRTLFIAGFLAAAAAQGSAQGAAINLVSNGSFESNSTTGNTSSFAGWTIGGTNGSGPGYGPEAFVTNGTTVGRYGDKVAADNATTPDPDASGTSAVYFVDDAATETLSQTIFLAAGTYEVGFDAFALASGYGNPNNATLSAQIAGAAITSASVSAMPKAAWQHFAANVTIYTAAYYTYTFTYVSGASAAKDVLVDDVYVITPSTLLGNGTFIGEPSSFSVAGAMAASLIVFRRRRTAA
jgi:hypothetical protein